MCVALKSWHKGICGDVMVEYLDYAGSFARLHINKIALIYCTKGGMCNL